MVVAALASNFSLSLNTVATYQLFKLLQTPILAVVEAFSGFRALSLTRALLMVGTCVSCVVCLVRECARTERERDACMHACMLTSTARTHTDAQRRVHAC